MIRSIFIDNPLIRRFAASGLRPSNLAGSLTVYFMILFGILVLDMLTNHIYTNLNNPNFHFRVLVSYFVIIQAMLGIVGVPYRTYTFFSEEQLKNSQDFFRLLPLNAHQKIFGTLIGRNLLIGLILCINLCITIVLGILSTITLVTVATLLLTLTLLTLLAGLLGMIGMGQTRKSKPRSKSTVFATIVFFMFTTSPFLPYLIEFNLDDQSTLPTPLFYRLPIPANYLPVLLLAGLNVCVYLLLQRMLTREYEPSISQFGGIAFYVVYLFVLTGFFWPYLKEDMGIGFGMCFSAAPLFFLPIGMSRSWENYLESSYRHSRDGKTFSWRELLLQSNPVAWLRLLSVWLAFALALNLYAGVAPLKIAVSMAGYTLFALLFALFIESIMVMLSVGANTPHVIIIFMAILTMLPPLASNFFPEDTMIHTFSVLGFVIEMLKANPERCYRLLPAFGVNLLILGIPLAIIFMRYQAILSLRHKMQAIEP